MLPKQDPEAVAGNRFFGWCLRGLTIVLTNSIDETLGKIAGKKAMPH